jgi:hypothetical protein
MIVSASDGVSGLCDTSSSVRFFRNPRPWPDSAATPTDGHAHYCTTLPGRDSRSSSHALRSWLLDTSRHVRHSTIRLENACNTSQKHAG